MEWRIPLILMICSIWLGTPVSLFLLTQWAKERRLPDWVQELLVIGALAFVAAWFAVIWFLSGV